ncbi:hypothetical protein FRC04_007810 [Tulasnella sp. 424]|nr:hypothetical protein FRC04_007810 [Tulasnella sp. 424]KAG8975285.1 hypothetical protein FRC05_006228 [Tulasnella sp. 425]
MTSNEHERLLSTISTAVRSEDSVSIDEESLKSVSVPAVTPLPKRQMFVLCWMRFSEPISYNLTLGGNHREPQPVASSSASSVTATQTGYGSTSNGNPVLQAEEEQAKPDPTMERPLVTVSIDAVWVLWLYMPIAKGGVGFTTSQIGIILSCVGVLATFTNLVIFPPLQRRVGTVALYQAAMGLQVVMVTLFPLVSKLAVWDAEATGGKPGLATEAGIAAMIITKCGGGVVFACNMILVSQSTPSRTSLGAVNGVAQMVASAMRAMGPTLATILFAVSTDPQFHALGGQLIWVYMVFLALAGVYASSKVQEGRVEDHRK